MSGLTPDLVVDMRLCFVYHMGTAAEAAQKPTPTLMVSLRSGARPRPVPFLSFACVRVFDVCLFVTYMLIVYPLTAPETRLPSPNLRPCAEERGDLVASCGRAGGFA